MANPQCLSVIVSNGTTRFLRDCREPWYYEVRRIDVKQVEVVERQLREAEGVADVLAAGWEIFELIGALAAASAGEAADMYPAFMFARGSAASGLAISPTALPLGHFRPRPARSRPG